MTMQHEQVIRAMAAGNQEDLRALEAEGQIDGWIDERNPNRIDGCSDWVAYLPSCNRACWITNGDPTWFDATSLDSAVEQVRSGAELVS